MEWRTGRYKLFATHVAREKQFVSAVADDLEEAGIHAFVAHSDIEPARSWHEEIEQALVTCEALAAFLHMGIRASDWADQDIGHCLARNVKIVPLRFDLNPYGFIGRYPAAACTQLAPASVASFVVDALLDDVRTRAPLTSAIVRSLARAEGYVMANRRSA